MRFLSLLLVSAWCGLVAGLLEVGTIVLRKQVLDTDQLYRMSRQFVWLIPLSNLVLFLAVGLVGCGVIGVAPRQGGRLFGRVLGALVLLPPLMITFPRIYGLAWFAVGLGAAAQWGPLIERNGRGFRRTVLMSLPAFVLLVAVMGASLWVSDRNQEARERARPLPVDGSPNVLLIVLDTVAAGHLSLYSYGRATSPALAEIAGRGIRFDIARAASSWTLPSHANMFTGRWLHELSVGWFTPLDQTFPTLAEYLGERGYATAGFIANTGYCAADSGLARGFTHYEDYIFPELTALKNGVLVNRGLERLRALVYYTEDWLDSAGLLHLAERLVRALDGDRKDAKTVNRELLDWLQPRGRADRPFFAFLNYNDAHYPYQLPPGRLHRFGTEPVDPYQRLLIRQWGLLDKKTVSPAGVAFAVDAYDDCIADLDEQLGILFDALDRSGLWQRTWLFIVADHGESFGEHPGSFTHGTSLYDTELHVPLVVIPPGGTTKKQVATEAVSLRDLAATIVDVVGQGGRTPFPGASLARFWKTPDPNGTGEPTPVSPAFAELVPHDPSRRDDWGSIEERTPLGALKERDWSYIRRGTTGREQLFHLKQDAREERNLAGEPPAQTALERVRAAFEALAGGPLVPERFAR